MTEISDWLLQKFAGREPKVKRQIAYTGGQGIALKKIKIELKLDYELHFFSTGAVFELKLRNYF